MPLPCSRHWRNAETITTPVSTATPERVRNPTPAEIDNGISRSYRAAIPPVNASGTPLNTSDAFADPKVIIRRP